MRTGLGSNYIPNAGSSSFNESAAPSTNTRSFETPAKIKFTCPIQDVRYFAVQRDAAFWGSQAFGIVAMDEASFKTLLINQTCPDVSTTINAARILADGLNQGRAKSDGSDHRGGVTAKSAANQSYKM